MSVSELSLPEYKALMPLILELVVLAAVSSLRYVLKLYTRVVSACSVRF